MRHKLELISLISLGLFKSFLFYIRVQLINNVFIVSGGQQRNSGYTCIHSLPKLLDIFSYLQVFFFSMVFWVNSSVQYSNLLILCSSCFQFRGLMCSAILVCQLIFRDKYSSSLTFTYSFQTQPFGEFICMIFQGNQLRNFHQRLRAPALG